MTWADRVTRELQKRLRRSRQVVAPDTVLDVDRDGRRVSVRLGATTGLTEHHPAFLLDPVTLVEVSREALELSGDLAIELVDDDRPGPDDYSRAWWIEFEVPAGGRLNRRPARAGPHGLWRVDASGNLRRDNYVLRWYRPGSRLGGWLSGRDFVRVHGTTAMRVMWLRAFAQVANEVGLQPDQFDLRRVRLAARRGWARSSVSDELEDRWVGLLEGFRNEFGRGRANVRPATGDRVRFLLAARTRPSSFAGAGAACHRVQRGEVGTVVGVGTGRVLVYPDRLVPDEVPRVELLRYGKLDQARTVAVPLDQAASFFEAA